MGERARNASSTAASAGRGGRGAASPGVFACALLMYVNSAGAEALPCREDERLSETAAALLLRGGSIAASELLAGSRAHGFDGTAVHARESADEASLRQWLARLAQGDEGVVTCGEARSEQRRLVLASVRGGRLWQVMAGRAGDERGRDRPDSRSGGEADGRDRDEGTSVLVRGALEPGFGSPSLVIDTTDGRLVSMAVTVRQLRAGVALAGELAPRRVQLVAESASGPRPVAELAFEPVPRSPISPRVLPLAADAVAPKLRPGAALVAELRAFRREAGVGALRDNRLLAESAQRHAARVCQLGRLAHRLEGEDPELRLRREHIAARGVGEVLARAESSDAAFQALLASASHRLALSRREFTDTGIGQASDDRGRVCLVVLLASWPRRTP